jgi:serine/threonine-protein kinase RsbW
MAECSISIELKNDLSELDVLEETLSEFAHRFGLTHKCNCQINLVLEELFSNIISYGFHDEAEHTVRITIDLAEGLMTVRIEDDGRAFNPLEVQEPDVTEPLENRPIGGLGIHLTRTVMDDISYNRTDDKNILILTKQISEP